MVTFPGRCSEAALDSLVGRLLAGPRWPQKEFVIGRTTYAALYAMAAHLRFSLGFGANGPPVCLCAQDKAVIAAALLTALAGGPAMVVPHAFSLHVLEELRCLTGFQTILTDNPMPAPAGVRCLQLAAGAIHRIFSGIELACRKFDNDLLHRITKLPDEENLVVQKQRCNHCAAVVVHHFANRSIPGWMHDFIPRDREDAACINFFVFRDGEGVHRFSPGKIIK